MTFRVIRVCVVPSLAYIVVGSMILMLLMFHGPNLRKMFFKICRKIVLGHREIILRSWLKMS